MQPGLKFYSPPARALKSGGLRLSSVETLLLGHGKVEEIPDVPDPESRRHRLGKSGKDLLPCLTVSHSH